MGNLTKNEVMASGDPLKYLANLVNQDLIYDFTITKNGIFIKEERNSDFVELK